MNIGFFLLSERGQELQEMFEVVGISWKPFNAFLNLLLSIIQRSYCKPNRYEDYLAFCLFLLVDLYVELELYLRF